jgi:uncharacterized protein (DUF1810 family)
MADAFDLNRFVTAQNPVYEAVLRELAAGEKSSHWMWFIFPQLRGLGRSSTASFYGIASVAEALAYARHPVLGARLAECCSALLRIKGKTALEVFGSPDDMKLRSSMTLFERAVPDASIFAQVLERYFAGSRDRRTLDLLDGPAA